MESALCLALNRPYARHIGLRMKSPRIQVIQKGAVLPSPVVRSHALGGLSGNSCSKKYRAGTASRKYRYMCALINQPKGFVSKCCRQCAAHEKESPANLHVEEECRTAVVHQTRNRGGHSGWDGTEHCKQGEVDRHGKEEE